MNLYLTDTTITSNVATAGISGFVGTDGTNYSSIYLSGTVYIDAYVLINANLSPFILASDLTDDSVIYVNFMNDTQVTVTTGSYIAVPNSTYGATLSASDDATAIGETNAKVFKILASGYYVSSFEDETLGYPVVQLQSYSSAQTYIYWNPVSGNDTYIGQSEATAVKTLERVQALSLATNTSSSAICTVYLLNTLTLTSDYVLNLTNAVITRLVSGTNAFTGVLFAVTDGNTLTLNNVTIDGGDTTDSSVLSAITVSEGGTLVINNGTVLRNHTAKISIDTAVYGGVINNAGTLIINGGQFYSNAVTSSGYGGVVATSGNVTVNGGTFYENSAISGGSVFYISGGSVNIYGGSFYGNSTLSINSSLAYGGAFLVKANASLNIYDGAFFDNVAKRGAVVTSYGTVNVYGGLFYSNEAEATLSSSTYSGTQGGVFAVMGGTTNIYAGTFFKNLASYGAVMFVSGGTVNIYDGLFEQNSALQKSSVYTENNVDKLASVEGTGGVAYIATLGVVNFYDGEMISNEASSKGGAIYNAGTFNMTGGTLSGNAVTGIQDINGDVKASGYGGAIYSVATGTVANGAFYDETDQEIGHITSSKMTISGGLIENNTAKYCAGAIAVVGSSATAILSNVILTGNYTTILTSGYAGAIYIGGGAFVEISSGTEIKLNSANYGGAIAIYNGSLLVTDGVIEQNGILDGTTKSVSGSAIYSSGDSDKIVIVGGEIVDNATTNSTSGAIHLLSGSKLYVGADVYVSGNLSGSGDEIEERNVYIASTSICIYVIEQFNLGAYVGVYSPAISSGTVAMIAMPMGNYSVTTKTLDYIVSDSSELYLYLDKYNSSAYTESRVECVYVGPKKQSVQATTDGLKFTASDYAGTYDGDEHSISVVVNSFMVDSVQHKDDIEVEYVLKYIAPTEQFFNSSTKSTFYTNELLGWSTDEQSIQSGTAYVYFRFIYGGNTVLDSSGSVFYDYRVISIEALTLEDVEFNNPSVSIQLIRNQEYPDAEDNIPLPELIGGSVVYNGVQIDGSFEWASSTIRFTEIGEQQANITFTPDDGFYSPISGVITVMVYTSKLYYGVNSSIDENALFYYDYTSSTSTLSNTCSKVSTMSDAIKYISANGYIYLLSTYTVSTVDEKSWGTSSTVNISRFDGFVGDMIVVASNYSLVIGKVTSSSGTLSAMTGTLNIYGGASWKDISTGATSQLYNMDLTKGGSYNTGIASNGSIIKVNSLGNLSLYSNVNLKNNEKQPVSNSTDSYYGGAVLSYGNVVLSGAQISDCMATYGGGIAVLGGEFSMVDGSFKSNSTYYSSSQTTGLGGAIYQGSGSVSIQNGTISYNKSYYNGGAIYIAGGTSFEINPNQTGYEVNIKNNFTKNEGTIYSVMSFEITGVSIEDNEVNQKSTGIAEGTAIYLIDTDPTTSPYVYVEFSANSVTNGQAITIVGQITLVNDAFIYQSITLSSSSAVTLYAKTKTVSNGTTIEADDYGISNILVIDLRQDAGEGYYDAYSIETVDVDYENLGLAVINEIDTQTLAGVSYNSSLQISGDFDMYIYYKEDDSTYYVITVTYGELYSDYINGAKLSKVVKVVGETEENLGYATVTLVYSGYSISGYGFFGSSLGSLDNVSNRAIYFNNNDTSSDYNIYAIWIMSAPTVQIVSTQRDFVSIVDLNATIYDTNGDSVTITADEDGVITITSYGTFNYNTNGDIVLSDDGTYYIDENGIIYGTSSAYTSGTEVSYGTAIFLGVTIANYNDTFAYTLSWIKNYSSSTSVTSSGEWTSTDVNALFIVKNVDESGLYTPIVIASKVNTDGTGTTKRVNVTESGYLDGTRVSVANANVALTPKIIEVGLTQSTYTYTGSAIYATTIQGTDIEVSGDQNLYVVDEETALQYYDTYASIILSVSDAGDYVYSAKDANVNDESYAMQILNDNNNYSISNNVLYWQILPKTLKIDHWIDANSSTKAEYTSAYEMDSSTSHLLVPIFSNTEGDIVNVAVDNYTGSSRDSGGIQINTTVYYSSSNGYTITSLTNTEKVTVTGIVAKNTIYTYIVGISNTNYQISTDDSDNMIVWYITGAQATINTVAVRQQEGNATNYTYASLESNDFKIEQTYSSKQYEITVNMKDKNDSIIASDGLMIKLSLTGTENSGNTVSSSVEYSILDADNSITFGAGTFVNVTNAGSYLVTVSIVKYRIVDNPSVTYISNYYVYNDDTSSYEKASTTELVEGETYYTETSYFESPTSTYTFNFVIKKASLTLQWEFDVASDYSSYKTSGVNESYTMQSADYDGQTGRAITYDKSTHTYSVIAPSIVLGSLTYQTNGSFINAGEYSNSAELTGDVSYNYDITGNQTVYYAVEKAVLKVTWPTADLQWNNQTQTYITSANISGVISGDTPYEISGNKQKDINSTTEGGEVIPYSCSISLKSYLYPNQSRILDNYIFENNQVTVSQSWYIVKRNVTLTWYVYDGSLTTKKTNTDGSYVTMSPNGTANVTTSTYDGKTYYIKPELGNLVTGFTSVAISIANPQGSGFNTDGENFADAGKYYTLITGVSGDNSSYYNIDDSLATSIYWEITKKNVTFTWVQEGTSNTNLSFEYDGESHSVKAKVNSSSIIDSDLDNGFVPIEVSAYVTQGDDDVTYTTSATEVGIYYAKILSIANVTGYDVVKNYSFENLAGTITAQWEITKRTLDITWTFNTDSLVDGVATYNGTAQYYEVGSVNNTLTNLTFAGESIVTLTYEKYSGNTVLQTILQSEADYNIINVGNYRVLATVGGSYATYYTISEDSSTMEWEIGKKSISVQWYDSNEDKLVADSTEVQEMTYLASSSTKSQYYYFAPVQYNIVSTDAVKYLIRFTASYLDINFETTVFAEKSANVSAVTLTDYIALAMANSINAGTYSAEIIGVYNVTNDDNQESSTNYTVSGSLSITWEIVPAQLSGSAVVADVNSSSLVYNGEDQTYVLLVEDTYQTFTTYLDSSLYTVSGNVESNVYTGNSGGWIATVTLNSNGNYIFTNGVSTSYTWNVTWNISPLEVELVWSYASNDYETAYTGASQVIKAEVDNALTNKSGSRDVVSVSSYSTATVPEAYLSQVGSNTTCTNVATDVGTYCAGAMAVDNANYAISSTGVYQVWKIVKKTISITWTANGSMIDDVGTYSKSAIYYSATLSGLVSGKTATLSYSYKYSSTQTSDWTTATTLDSSASCINAGYYQVSVTLASGSESYQLPTSASKTWTIKQRSLIFSWANTKITYTGNQVKPNATGTNICSGDSVTIATYLHKSSTGDWTSTAPSAVGTYTTKITSITGDDSANYTLEGTNNNISVTWEIVAIRVSFSFTTNITDGSWTYDKTTKYYKGELSTIIADLTLVTTITYTSVDGLNTYTVSGTDNCINAGTYKAVVSLGGTAAANYSLANYSSSALTKTWSIAQKEVTFTWDSTGSTRVEDDVFYYSYSGEMISVKASVVGSVTGDTVTVKDTDGSNDGYRNNSATRIGSYVAEVYSLDTAYVNNYYISKKGTASQSWVIETKELTVTWDGGTMTDANNSAEYNGSVIKWTPSITSGNVFGTEQVYLVTKITKSDVEVSSSIDVGSYTITITGLTGVDSTNYSIENLTNTTKSWTITQKELTYEYDASEDGFSINDDTLQAVYVGSGISFGVTLVGLVEDDAEINAVIPLYAYNVPDITYISTNGNSGSITSISTPQSTCVLTNVYTYAIALSLGNYGSSTKASNYVLASGYTTATFAVTKAQLSAVSWSSTINFTYNGSTQTPTLTLSGIQNNEKPYNYIYSYYDNSNNPVSMSTTPDQVGSYNVEVALSTIGAVNYEWSDTSTTTKTLDYRISSAEPTYTVIPLKMGSPNGTTDEEKKTIVLIVFYGVSENAQADSPLSTSGSVFDYLPLDDTAGQIAYSLTTSSISSGSYQTIYATYQNIIDDALAGTNVSYDIITYTETNTTAYTPKISYSAALNNLSSTTSYTNYKSFSLTDVNSQDAKLFLPSSLTQSAVSTYYYDTTAGTYTQMKTNTTISTSYGSTVTLFVTGGTNFVTTENPSGTNEYYIEYNSVAYDTSTTLTNNGVPCVITYSNSDNNIGFSATDYYSVGFVMVTITFNGVGTVNIRGVKAGGTVTGSGTFVDSYSSSGTSIINVGKKAIQVNVPDATMSYYDASSLAFISVAGANGTTYYTREIVNGVAVDTEVSIIVDEANALVNESDKADILADVIPAFISGYYYDDFDVGTHSNSVTIEFLNSLYSITLSRYGTLFVSGMAITNDDVQFSINDSNCVYTGVAQTPTSITLSYVNADSSLTAITYSDENITYSNNINAGSTAKVTIVVNGNYVGTLSATYTIAKLNISGSNLPSGTTLSFDSSLTDSVTYTGDTITKSFESNGVSYVKVVSGSTATQLVSGTDFNPDYQNNKEAGTATITLTGSGNNVTGTRTLTFTITKKTISTSDITDYSFSEGNEISFSGHVIKPTISTIKVGTKSFDYDKTSVGYYTKSGDVYTAVSNVYGGAFNVGTYYVGVTINKEKSAAYYNYTGIVYLQFKIVAMDISNNNNIELSFVDEGPYYFKASNYFPTITVKWYGPTWTTDPTTGTKTETGENSWQTLTVNTSYTIDKSSTDENGNLVNYNVGDAAVTIDGSGNFTGTKSIAFEIEQRDISLVSGSTSLDTAQVITAETFTGRQISPTSDELLVQYNDEDVTYTITAYGENISAGTNVGSVTISGTGNYTGSYTIYFDISKLQIDSSKLTATFTQLKYYFTGEAIVPTIAELRYTYTATDGTSYYLVISSSDYTIGTCTNNINAGTLATMPLSFNTLSNYTGNASISFTIYARAITSDGFVLSEADATSIIGMSPKSTLSSVVYTGTAITKTLYVYLINSLDTSGNIASVTQLTAVDDYNLAYSSNINVGTAYVKVTGNGNYDSSSYFSTSFEIIAMDIATAISNGYLTVSSTTVTNDSTTKTTAMVLATLKLQNEVYTRTEITPVLIITTSTGSTLVKLQDYKLSLVAKEGDYGDNKSVGTNNRLKISGTGNFKGSCVVYFDIVARNLSTLTSSMSAISDQEYTGSAVTPSATISITDGKYKLVQNTDYTVSYSNNTTVGTASVIITGIGNYQGDISSTFDIVSRNISTHHSEFVLTAPDKTYTGSAITLTNDELIFVYSVTGETLTSNDFSIVEGSFSNNTNVGIASFSIQGNRYFTGTYTYFFNIVAQSYNSSTWTIDLSNGDKQPSSSDGYIYRYSGDFVTPVPVIYDANGLEVDSTYYTLTYISNQGVSHIYSEGAWVSTTSALPTITIAFATNYSGNASVTFGIGKVEITLDEVTVSFWDTIYYDATEKQIAPDDIVLKLSGTTYSDGYTFTANDFELVEGSSYFTNSTETSSGTETDNKSVGTGAFTITFGGSNDIYSGTITIDYTINRLSLNASNIFYNESLTSDETYTGLPITKDLVGTITIGEGTGAYVLVQGTDFSLDSYSSNIDSGVVTITLYGMGNFTSDSKTLSFTISPRSLDSKTDGQNDFVISQIADQTYNYGTEITLSNTQIVLNYTYDGATTVLAKDEDYAVYYYLNNTNVGTATIVLSGAGNFSGVLSQTFNIVAKSITSSNIALTSGTNKFFTGEEYQLVDGNENGESYFNITIDGKETIKVFNADILASAEQNSVYGYFNNINVGNATVKFELTSGNYLGSELTLVFTILARQYSSSTFSIPAIYDQLGTGSFITPDYVEHSGKYVYTSGPITYTNDAGTVIQLTSSDYTLTYKNNKNYGLAYVTISFSGNYTGSVTKTFQIVKATPTLQDFENDIGTNYYVVPQGSTSASQAIRYGEVSKVGDLIIVNSNGEEISSLSWVSSTININSVGTYSAYAYYNPNSAIYNSLTVSLSFTVQKGLYSADEIDVYQGGEQYVSAYYEKGIALSSISLPAGYSWMFQEVDYDDIVVGQTYYTLSNGTYTAVVITTKVGIEGNTYYESDVDLDKDSYVISTNADYLSFVFKAKYNDNADFYEDYTDISVNVRLYRGNLNADTFTYKTIYVTYTKNLTPSSIFIKSPWSWLTTQSGYNTSLKASDTAYEMTLIYNPLLATDDGTIISGGFPSSLFGKKQNYNSVEVKVKIYVQKADYLKTDVETLLSAYNLANQTYKTDLTVADLNLTLPDGFSFENINQSLLFGSNSCAVIYNADSAYNSNYNPFGETLSERIYLTINVVSPSLKGELSQANDTANEVELSSQNGLVVVRTYESLVGANGDTVPYIVYYYDQYLSTWTQIAGTAKWVNGSEKLLSVGYITRTINFYPVDTNFTSGAQYTTFDVTIQITQVSVDTASVSFASNEQTITYKNSPTLSRISKITVTATSAFTNTDDVYYTYKKVYFDANGNIVTPTGEDSEFTAETVFDAGGIDDEYEFAYLVTAHFDKGYCTYFNFGDYAPSMYVYVEKADLVLTLPDVTRTYGDNIINNDTVSRVEGLSVLDESDYEMSVYDEDGVAVALSSSTDAGTYTLVLKLASSVSNNYVVKNSSGTVLDDLTLTSNYTIASKVISDFTLNINGILRETGEIHNSKISVSFDASEFINWEIPDYELVITKDGKVVSNVISTGTYYVGVVFVGNNYVVNKTYSFQVYETSGYQNILLIAIIIGSVLLVAFVIILSIRLSRAKYRKSIQKEQFKRIKKKLDDDPSKPKIQAKSPQQKPKGNNKPNDTRKNE
jgi:hypothetical protein